MNENRPRIKATTSLSKLVEFFVHNLVVCNSAKDCAWAVLDNGEYAAVYPSTFKPAEDPRKQMLNEIRIRLKTLRWWSHFEDFKDLALVSLADVDEILREKEVDVIMDTLPGEMEAKL